MTTVFSPHCEARTAVLYPPGPLPMIARSYLAKCPPRRAGTPLKLREFRSGSSRETAALDVMEMQPASALSRGSRRQNQDAREFRASILSAARKCRNMVQADVLGQIRVPESAESTPQRSPRRKR